MMPVCLRNAVVSIGFLGGVFSASAAAQGLLFYLPEDGTGVEYEGQVIQETLRPELEDGREELQWTRSLTIKSVGREDAEFEGTVQPCRWIEIKTVTGTAGAGGVDPGLVGMRIYRILVPEQEITDRSADDQGIPRIVLPIVRGFRRLGEESVEPIGSRGITFYPTLTLLAHYENPEVVSDAESVSSISGQDTFDAQHLRGRFVRERPDARSINTADYWISRDVPFGLAAWSVKVVRETKGSTDLRDSFEVVSTTTCNMKVREILDAVEPELTVEE